MPRSSASFDLLMAALREGAQAEPAEPVRELAGHGAVLLVGRRAPPEPAELVEQRAVARRADDVEVAAAVRQRLDADAEHALQGEELAKGEGAAALADLEPQRLGGHEERPGQAARHRLGVETAGHVEHDVAELVGDGEPLPLAPVLGVTTTMGTGRSPGRRARAARPPTASSGRANTLTPRSSSSSTRLGTGS